MHAVFGEEWEVSPTSKPERGWGRQIHGALQKPGALWCWNHPYEKRTTTHRRNGYFLQRNIDCLSLKKSIVKILQDVQQHLCAASSVCIYSYASWNPVVLTSHIPRGGPFPSEAHMLRFTAAALLSKPRQSISGGFCDESGAYLSQRDWHTLNKKG